MHDAAARLASGALDAAAASLELDALSRWIDVMNGVTSDLEDVGVPPRFGRLLVRSVPTDLRGCLAGCRPHGNGSAVGGSSCAVQLDVADDVPREVDLDPLRLRQVCGSCAVQQPPWAWHAPHSCLLVSTLHADRSSRSHERAT